MGDVRDSSQDLVDLTRTVAEQLHFACCILHIFVDTFYTLKRLIHRCTSTLRIQTRLTRYFIQNLRPLSHVAAGASNMFDARGGISDLLELYIAIFYQLCH